MICRISVTPNSTRDASFSLAPPPSATLFSLPVRVFSSMEHRRAGGYIDNYGSIVFASSGDGLLLLKATWHRFSAHASLDSPRPREVLAKDLVEEEHVSYVCNPVTGQLVRLPPSWGTKHLTTATGLLTQADRGRGPPKRYAAAELIEAKDVGHFVLCRFRSETGEWDVKERLSPLPPGRVMRMWNHEVLAFAGRLWWVDVSWGAVSADPFKDEPQLGHVKLPEGSELPDQDANEGLELTKHRRMGVSDGRLLYVEVSEEEPFQIKSFMLDGESGPWALQHQVSLDTLWPNGGDGTKERPLVVAIDPLNTDLLYLNMGSEEIVSVDLRGNRVIDAYSVLSSDIPTGCRLANIFLPCVLPSFLGSSLIPGELTVAHFRSVTLPACILVSLFDIKL
ncbi:hypothetical protein CFC21_017510 [Triticum aestivum]|uniref:F-box protein At3g26010-like beta-propeller domain-containing protein n=2 Tax=Triticum aestivum TaxID=4565 RepID=A0A3B6AZS5_WHEAT|nr:hypothetical protein CFC21_017510 [Triticum aestivum]